MNQIRKRKDYMDYWRFSKEEKDHLIHLLMATQSTKVISDLTLSHGTIEQMRIRIGLKCGENDARYLFSDENDSKALAMMKGPITSYYLVTLFYLITVG